MTVTLSPRRRRDPSPVTMRPGAVKCMANAVAQCGIGMNKRTRWPCRISRGMDMLENQ